MEAVDKAGSLPSLILPSVPYTQRSQEFDSAVGRVVASYKLDQDAMAYAGYIFRLTPKHTLAVGANLEQPLEDRGLVAFLTPSFIWKSRVYFEDANSSAPSQSPYGLLNARLGLPTYIAGTPRLFGAQVSVKF